MAARSARKATTKRKTGSRKATTRRKTSYTRATSAKKPGAAQAVPSIPPGQRVWLMELPWGGLDAAKPAGVTYYKSLTAHAYVGTTLPSALKPYACKPYSYLRWLEDELNGSVSPGATAAPMTLRPEQRADVDATTAAAEHHFRQVHLANDVGSPANHRAAPPKRRTELVGVGHHPDSNARSGCSSGGRRVSPGGGSTPLYADTGPPVGTRH